MMRNFVFCRAFAIIIAPPLIVYSAVVERESEFRHVAVTLSPVMVYVGVLQGAFEYQPNPKLGFALQGGTGDGEDGTLQQGMHYRSVETKFHYYPDIEGEQSPIQLGVSARWWRERSFMDPMHEILSLGPLLGAKYVSSAGFTFGLQLLYYQPVYRAYHVGGGEPSGGKGLWVDAGIGWSI